MQLKLTQNDGSLTTNTNFDKPSKTEIKELIPLVHGHHIYTSVVVGVQAARMYFIYTSVVVGVLAARMYYMGRKNVREEVEEAP